MPPLLLRKVDSTGSLSSVASSPDSSFRKKLKSPRELPPSGLHPRRRLSSDGSGPPPLMRSRSNSSDVGGSSSSTTSEPNRRRTQSYGSPTSTTTPLPPNKQSTEKGDLDVKLQRAILQYGSSDPRVGDLWNAMGNSYFRTGDLKGAIRAYKSAALCGSGPHVATACLNLGTAYWNSMQVKKATEYLQKALQAFQTDLAAEGKSPLESLEIASCYHQLGLAYSLEESYGKACTSMEKALDIRVRALGAHSPITARTMDAAGRVQMMRGDLGRALSYHEQALTILTQAGFSPVGTLGNLAAVYRAQGDVTAAIHMYVQIVHYIKSNWMTQPAPGPLCDSLMKLADAYEQVGELRYAEDCRNEAELLG